MHVRVNKRTEVKKPKMRHADFFVLLGGYNRYKGFFQSMSHGGLITRCYFDGTFLNKKGGRNEIAFSDIAAGA